MQNFPVIDKWQNGVATSIKSIDLNSKTYQNTANLIRQVRSYADKLAQWQGQLAPWGGKQIFPSQVQSRVLQLAIPPGASPAQQQALQSIQQYANDIGIRLEIVIIP